MHFTSLNDMKVFCIKQYESSTYWQFYTDGGRLCFAEIKYDHIIVSVETSLEIDGYQGKRYTVYLTPLTVQPDDRLNPYRDDIETIPLNLNLYLEERAARAVALELGFDKEQLFQMQYDQPVQGLGGYRGLRGCSGINGWTGHYGFYG